MWLSVIAILIAAVVSIVLFVIGNITRDDEVSGTGIMVGIVAIGITIVTLFCSTVNISTGTVGLEKDYSGSYTGKVFSETGTHILAVAPSHSVDEIDVRNNKLPVSVNVMKDKTYNVTASVEVVYDLNPSKLVELKSKYSDYKNTVIGATVKQVLTSNNTLANSQSLSEKDAKEITDKLKGFGIEVTNMYMNSYKLTNSSNFSVNGNMNNGNDK